MTNHLAIPTGLIWTHLQFRRRRSRLPRRVRTWSGRYPSPDHSFRVLRRYLSRYNKPARRRWTLSRRVFSSSKSEIADAMKQINSLFIEETIGGNSGAQSGRASGDTSGGGVLYLTADQILADWDKPQSLSPQEQSDVNQALSTWLKFISDDTPRSDREVIQFTLSLCSGWKPAPRLELDRLMRKHTQGVLRSRAKSQVPQ